MNEAFPALRVLIVEDEPLIRWSIAETLAHEGHTVLEAGSASAAVQKLTNAADSIDVVLLDYRLPDSNDLNLLAAVRRLTPNSAVVMMTAYGAPEITQGALNLGAHRVMSKPFDMHGLGAVVQEAHRASTQPH